MHDERFTNDAVRDVLARAIDFDQRRTDTISRRQLESIAAELGISEAAVAAALRERRGASLHEHVQPKAGIAVAAWAGIGGLSSVAAAAGYSATQLPVFTLSLAGWIGLSMGLAAFGSTRLHRYFQIRNTGLWLGVAGVQLASVLWDTTFAESVRIVLVPNAILWLGTSIAGAVILKLRQLRQRELDASGTMAPTWWSDAKGRVRVHLKAWIDRVLSRCASVLKPNPARVITFGAADEQVG